MPRITFDEKQSGSIAAIEVTTEKQGTLKKGYHVDLKLRDAAAVQAPGMQAFLGEYSDKVSVTRNDDSVRMTIPPHHPADQIAQSLGLTLTKHGLVAADQAGRIRTDLTSSKERGA